MTYVITSILHNDLAEMRARADRARRDGADIVELRVDLLAEASQAIIDWIRAEQGRRWIVTCRSQAEGGQSPLSDDERLRLLSQFARSTHAIIDVEWRTLQSRGDAVAALLTATSGPAAEPRLIASYHDFNGQPPDLEGVMKLMRAGAPNAVVKIAWRGCSAMDNLIAFDLLRTQGRPTALIVVGEDGLLSRVLGPKVGAWGTYCAASPDEPTAPGQLTVRQLLEEFRFPRIGPATRLFGVIGDPVAHSMSPMLFNAWFDGSVDAVYVPIRIDGSEQALHDWLDEVTARPWLGFGGFSVTVPHKVHALSWLGDRADRQSIGLGAVNTIVLCDGQASGHNTDCTAAIASLAAAVNCSVEKLNEHTFDVLGTGGAARAVAIGLSQFGCKPTIFGRTAAAAERLAGRCSGVARDWPQRESGRGDVLINCTSVGMSPRIDESPMPADSLSRYDLVYDVVYNPLKTRLLRDAEQLGVQTLSGLDMFVRQAAVQYELWIGTKPDLESGRKLIEQHLVVP